MPKNTYRLTDETVHVLRIAGVVWNSETPITDRHLAFPKRKCEEAEFIEETAHGLYREDTPGKCNLNIVNHYDDTGILIWVTTERKIALLTQISAFVVMIFPLYRLTISGARYDKVVYLVSSQ